MVRCGGPPSSGSILVAGEHFTCALPSATDLYCWGSNSHGQLGIGTIAGSLVPVIVNFP